jgi:hypothetical protein
MRGALIAAVARGTRSKGRMRFRIRPVFFLAVILDLLAEAA